MNQKEEGFTMNQKEEGFTMNQKEEGFTMNPNRERKTPPHQNVRPDRSFNSYVSVIEKYLKVAVEPVLLPEIDDIATKRVYNTYPPLIVDGASGVGKTQQAFALLKGDDNQEPQKLVYLVLGAMRERGQLIYMAMMDTFEMKELKEKIPDTWKEVIESGRNLDIADQERIDYLSIETLGRILLQKKSGNSKLNEFIGLLWSRALKYDEKTSKIEYAYDRGQALHRTMNQKLHDLRGTVFFIDEALPAPASIANQSGANDGHNETFTTANDRLKFLRNLGRVLGMRVVLAGTAATAANLSTMPNNVVSEWSQSREEHTEYTWAVVQFLYNLVPEENSRISHRPWIHTWLRENRSKYQSLPELILARGDKIGNAKMFTRDTKFIWLTGACLSTKENMLSPFELKPAALVRGHFFEPAVATCEYKRGRQHYTEIHDGKGFGKISRKIRPNIRLKIIKYLIGTEWYWVLRQDNETETLKPIFDLEYHFIEYALTNCTQVCLATEPLLAVCISESHFMTSDEFKKAIHDALPRETTVQRNKGGLDGELHEQIIFAALQLSSNYFMDIHRTVQGCVEELFSYLRPHSIYESEKYNRVAEILKLENINVVGKSGSQEVSFGYHEHADQKWENEAEEMFQQSVKMPWLVPACDKESLQQKIQDFGADYFGDLNIAGLVPGVTNAAMDAEAFIWKNQQNGIEPDWSFEFKARTEPYSPNAAMKDLMKKMTYSIPNDTIVVDGKRKKETSMKHVKAHHGMLIGITNTDDCRCEYCLVDVDGKKYLRVIVLIGLSKL